MCPSVEELLEKLADLINTDEKITSIRMAIERVTEEAGISKRQAKSRAALINEVTAKFKQSNVNNPETSVTNWKIAEARINLAERKSGSKSFKGKTGSECLDELQAALDRRNDKKSWPYIQLSSQLLRIARDLWRARRRKESILWKVLIEERVDALEEILAEKGKPATDDDYFVEKIAAKIRKMKISMHMAANQVVEEERAIWEMERGVTIQKSSLVAAWTRKFKKKYPSLSGSPNTKTRKV